MTKHRLASIKDDFPVTKEVKPMHRRSVATCSCGQKFIGETYHAARRQWWAHAHPEQAKRLKLLHQVKRMVRGGR